MLQESKGHVLIVDDDASIKRMFQLLLKDAGYRVSTAASGQEVLQFLRVLTPDVMLLDISLPGMDGVELTRRIKSDPDQPFIPIILITALGDMRTKIAGLDAGADDFLVKPVEFAELLARLRVMVRLQQTRRSFHESNQRVETLLRVSQALTSTLDIEDLLQRMVSQLADSLGAVRGSIVLVNRAHPSFASASDAMPTQESINHTLREGVAGWVIRSRRALILADARRDSRWASLGRSQDTTRSVLAVPIVHEQDVLGVITLVHSSVSYFQHEHLELVESVAAQSALALRHAHLFDLTSQQKIQLERRSHMLEEILNVSERLRLNLALTSSLDEIAESVYRSLEFGGVAILIQDGSETVTGTAGDITTSLSAIGADWQQTIESQFKNRYRVSRSYYVPAQPLQEAETFDIVSMPATTWNAGDLVVVPIGSLTQLTGILIVRDPVDKRIPDITSIQALEIFADLVANAVQNTYIFARERERANQLQLLVDVGRNLTELMTPDQLLRLVSSLIQHVFDFWSVVILLADETGAVLRAAAHATGDLAPVGMVAEPNPVLERVIGNGTIVRNDTAHSLCLDYHWLAESVRSELAVPILTRNTVSGALIVGSDREFAFDDVAESLLTALASQLAVALENARLFIQEQTYQQRLSSVNNLSVRLSAELLLQQHLDQAMQDVATIFNVSHTTLAYAQRVHDHVETVSTSADLATVWLPQASDLFEWLPTTTFQRISKSSDQMIHQQLLRTCQLESAVLMPLAVSEQCVGVLVLDGAQHHWTSNDRSLLQTVANLLAQALENSLLYATVITEQQTLAAVLRSVSDPLVVIGPQDELLLFNPPARESLQLSDADLYQPLAHPLLQSLLSPDSALPAEYSLPDGMIVHPVMTRLSATEGQEASRVLVLQDITALKLLEQQRMQRLRDDMSRYMSPHLVDQLLSEGSFGTTTERDVVVLFADLRGFTTLSEQLEARVVVEQVLNRFFTEMTQVLYRFEATIDKFLGDGLMAVFGSVRQRDDDVMRALDAAIAMQQAFDVLHNEWREQFGHTVGLGIGLSYGHAVVGNLGSAQRLDYTVIGDVVNTASRLVDLAHGGQIIVSAPLSRELPPEYAALLSSLPPVELKGKQEPQAIYAVAYTQLSTPPGAR